MAGVEYYGKLHFAPGSQDEVFALLPRITAHARHGDRGVLRCDWFARPGIHECITMTAFANDAAAEAFFSRAAAEHAHLSRMARGEILFLGEAPSIAHEALEEFSPRSFRFIFGQKPQPQRTPAPGIEVYTLFELREGEGAAFETVGRELVSIVKARDPGTTRYDWFRSPDDRQWIAMDSYADAPSMFAHMKNAHDTHELLFRHATMKVEFLGELPAEARAAVAKYDPYVLGLHCGLG